MTSITNFCFCFLFSHFFQSHFLFFRSTEHVHVIENLLVKLLCIRTFKKLKLKDFKDLISVADYKMCETKMDKNPTWYPLILDVFVDSCTR